MEVYDCFLKGHPPSLQIYIHLWALVLFFVFTKNVCIGSNMTMTSNSCCTWQILMFRLFFIYRCYEYDLVLKQMISKGTSTMGWATLQILIFGLCFICQSSLWLESHRSMLTVVTIINYILFISHSHWYIIQVFMVKQLFEDKSILRRLAPNYWVNGTQLFRILNKVCQRSQYVNSQRCKESEK